MSSLEEQKTQREIEKLKEEIKELRTPFYRKASFFSGFYLPILLIGITAYLNKDYITKSNELKTQTVELQSVKQQLIQLQLDTATAANERKRKALRRQDSVLKKGQLSIDRERKQQTLDSTQNIAFAQQLTKRQDSLAARNAQFLTARDKFKGEYAAWEKEKLQVIREQQQYGKLIDSIRTKFDTVNQRLAKSQNQLNRNELCVMLTSARLNVHVVLQELSDYGVLRRPHADGVLEKFTKAEQYAKTVQLTKPLASNDYYNSYKKQIRSLFDIFIDETANRKPFIKYKKHSFDTQSFNYTPDKATLARLKKAGIIDNEDPSNTLDKISQYMDIRLQAIINGITRDLEVYPYY